MDSSILEIIPKITSPLAVVSFIAYIVFLIKQSNDRKQEKTLSVPDPKAQKKAVKDILKDYPDVELTKITDPVALAELAKQVIENKLERYQKTLSYSLAFTIIFAVTYLASLLIGKIDRMNQIFEVSDETWAVKESLREGKDYAMLNVTLHIRVEDVKKKKDVVRRALFRTHYSLRALHDIAQDDKVFGEQYYSNVVKIEQWPGSETETKEVIDGLYYVRFAAKKNDVKTLTTGADYYYPLPLEKGNKACFGVVPLKDNEWVWCYPNTSDFIDNLTIIVEAQNIELDLPENATFRSDKDSKLLFGDGICNKTDSECKTLVAKWKNIRPNECLAFKIAWSPPVNPSTLAKADK